MSILVTGGYLVTMNPARDVLDGGFVGIRDGTIAEVGAHSQTPQYAYDEVIDARGMIVLPGLINAHHHPSHNLLRGLGRRMLPTRIDGRYPHDGPLLEPDDLRASSALAAMELVRTGTTCCLNHAIGQLDERRQAAMVEPIRDVGLRHVLAGSVDADNGGAIRRFAARWRDGTTHPALAIEVRARALVERATRERAIKDGYDQARQEGLRITAHAACDLLHADDYREAMRHTGRSDVLYLMELGVLDERWILSHLNHVTDTDLALMREAGCHAVWTPTSDAIRGFEPAPWARMVRMGINCALGTDGPLFDPSVDMVEQMKASVFIANVTGLDATAMSAERALEMATVNAARALGLEKEIGSLEAGKRADVAVFDMREPHVQVINKPISNFVTTGRGADAHAVIVDGALVWRSGEFRRGPQVADVMAAAKQAGHRLAVTMLL